MRYVSNSREMNDRGGVVMLRSSIGLYCSEMKAACAKIRLINDTREKQREREREKMQDGERGRSR